MCLAFLIPMMLWWRPGGAEPAQSILILLHTGFALLIGIGWLVDRRRIAASERVQAPAVSVYVCRPSGFQLAWDATCGLATQAAGIALWRQLVPAGDDVSVLQLLLPILSFVVWGAVPILGYVSSWNVLLVISAESLSIPGRGQPILWRDITGFELERDDCAIDLLLFVSPSSPHRRVTGAFSRWFNPMARAENEIEVRLSGYDRSVASIYQAVTRCWSAADKAV